MHGVIPEKLRRRAAATAESIITITPTLDLSVDAPKVIEALAGDGDVFLALDERPYEFPDYYRVRHWLVRSVRNHPHWGPKLFESFR